MPHLPCFSNSPSRSGLVKSFSDTNSKANCKADLESLDSTVETVTLAFGSLKKALGVGAMNFLLALALPGSVLSLNSSVTYKEVSRWRGSQSRQLAGNPAASWKGPSIVRSCRLYREGSTGHSPRFEALPDVASGHVGSHRLGCPR